LLFVFEAGERAAYLCAPAAPKRCRSGPGKQPSALRGSTREHRLDPTAESGEQSRGAGRAGGTGTGTWAPPFVSPRRNRAGKERALVGSERPGGGTPFSRTDRRRTRAHGFALQLGVTFICKPLRSALPLAPTAPFPSRQQPLPGFFSRARKGLRAVKFTIWVRSANAELRGRKRAPSTPRCCRATEAGLGRAAAALPGAALLGKARLCHMWGTFPKAHGLAEEPSPYRSVVPAPLRARWVGFFLSE